MCGGAGKRVDGVFPGRPQSFRHQRRPVDDCSLAQDEGECRRTGEQVAEHYFMAKWIVAEVYSNVTGRTKERIAQSKRARAGLLDRVD